MQKTISIFLLFLTVSCMEHADSEHKKLIEKAKEIHTNVITIDTHDDINVKNFTDSINYTQRLSTQVDLPKMVEGGLDVAWFIVYTGQDTLSAQGYAKAEEHEGNQQHKTEAIHGIGLHDIECITGYF